MNATPPSPGPPACPACSGRLEADGVCLACALNEALHVHDEALEPPGVEARAFAKLGRPFLPCDFAGHRLLRELGGGGMGLVFEAEDVKLKRPVALKMIRCAAFARPEEMVRFRAEAELAAGLDHPHIVPIYDVGEAESIPLAT